MVWFVMIPPDYQSKTTAEKNLVDFRINYTDPKAIAAVQSGTVINGSNYGNGGNPQVGEDLIKWLGPFNTEAQAKAAQNPTQQSPNPINDAVNAAQNSDVLGSFNIGSWFLRIGEILLGLVLVGVGVARLTGAQNAISQIVKTKMPVPIPV
jgi:hypothetical protein